MSYRTFVRSSVPSSFVVGRSLSWDHDNSDEKKKVMKKGRRSKEKELQVRAILKAFFKLRHKFQVLKIHS
jgi:hypothetical protein